MSDHKIKDSLKILLVEDEPISLFVHQAMLKELGYEPDSSQNGCQALNLISSMRYGLILLDIGLPDINGFEVAFKAREIERKYRYQPTYIVALTAYSLTEIKEKCSLAGIDEIILKPATTCQFQELLDKISF